MPCSKTSSALVLLFLLAAAVITLAGCGGGSSSRILDDPSSPRLWTVLVYMAADNSLEEYGIFDINEMEAIGSTSQATVLVQIDRRPGGDASNGDWTTTRRYRITKDYDEAVINSELLADLGELNMADPATLADFVQWGVENYPARNYLLVLWDHGRGWQSRALTAAPREVRAIHQDVTSGSDEMSLAELEQAFASLPRMGTVVFDACLMGMLEVAYSIADSADIMIASEEEIPVEGLPYQSLVGRLVRNPTIEPGALASAIVDDYNNHYLKNRGPCTLSAIDLSRLPDVVAAVDNFAATMAANLSAWSPAIAAAASQTQHYDSDSTSYTTYTDYRDLYDFAARVRDSVVNAQVRASASSVISAVDSLVIAQRNTGGSVGNSHGVSIYLPTPDTRSDALLAQYAGISFGRDTRWDEFLAAY